MSRYHLRRADRELADARDVESVLRRGRYATVGLVHDGAPYEVSLSYGYDADRRALYFHVAREGRKLDAIAADPRACATVVIDHGYQAGECKQPYESVVIDGTMSVVDDPAERRRGMRVLIGHLEGEPDTLWKQHHLDQDEPYEGMRVARLDIESITGKTGS